MRSLQSSPNTGAGQPAVPAGNPARGGCGGMSLVEIMFGMVVVGTACLAGLAGMLFCLRVSDSNLRALTAASAARSISEQLQSIPYESLFEAEIPVDTPSSATGSLTAGAWNARTDDLRDTPLDSSDDLRMSICPTITRIVRPDGVDYAQVIIRYEWLDSSFFAPRARSDSLALIVAPVSQF